MYTHTHRQTLYQKQASRRTKSSFQPKVRAPTGKAVHRCPGGSRAGEAGATSFPLRTPWTRSEARAAPHPASAAGPGSLGLTLPGPGGREQEPGHAGPRKRYRAHGPSGDASERSLGRPGIPSPAPEPLAASLGLSTLTSSQRQAGPEARKTPSGEPSCPGVREDYEGQEGPQPERGRRAQRRPGRVRARVLTMSWAWASWSP